MINWFRFFLFVMYSGLTPEQATKAVSRAMSLKKEEERIDNLVKTEFGYRARKWERK